MPGTIKIQSMLYLLLMPLQLIQLTENKKDTYVEVPCPASIRKYNEEMGGVDRFNQLMSLFSLRKLLTFDRYYKKVAMVLMDFVLINAFYIGKWRTKIKF